MLGNRPLYFTGLRCGMKETRWALAPHDPHAGWKDESVIEMITVDRVGRSTVRMLRFQPAVRQISFSGRGQRLVVCSYPMILHGLQPRAPVPIIFGDFH